MRHAFAGLPLTRTRTGGGRPQAGLIAVAREALTRMNGLPPRILTTAVKPVVMKISNVWEGIRKDHPRKCTAMTRFVTTNDAGITQREYLRIRRPRSRRTSE